MDPLAHQFDDLDQQHEASNFGMWIFLATEIMFFGGMFTAYAIYRHQYFADFAAGSHLLNWRFGATNTAVLICSSLTMALAVHAAQTGKRKALVTYLVLTILLGMAFLGIKFTFEWSRDWAEHLIPGELIAGHPFGPGRGPEAVAGGARFAASCGIVHVLLFLSNRLPRSAHGGGHRPAVGLDRHGVAGAILSRAV